MRWTKPPLAALLFALATAMPAAAESIPDVDHNQVRNMVRRGEIWSLDRILADMERQFPDLAVVKLVSAKFELAQRRYHLSLLSIRGHYLKLVVDARTGRILDQYLGQPPEEN